jgi:hypothetical protein
MSLSGHPPMSHKWTSCRRSEPAHELKSEEKSELHFPNFSLNFSPEFARPRPCFLRPILDCEITSEVMKNRKKPEIARITGGVLIQNPSGHLRQIREKTDHLGDIGGVKKDPENCFSRSNFLALKFTLFLDSSPPKSGPRDLWKRMIESANLRIIESAKRQAKSFPLDRY